jgi:hypothetical protein
MTQEALSKQDILKAFQALSEELGARGTKGELCLPVKAQYVVESLFQQKRV